MFWKGYSGMNFCLLDFLFWKHIFAYSTHILEIPFAYGTFITELSKIIKDNSGIA